jgi:hypothetical protein
VLLNFEDQLGWLSFEFVFNFECLINGREGAVGELHVHDRADDLNNATFVFHDTDIECKG